MIVYESHKIKITETDGSGLVIKKSKETRGHASGDINRFDEAKDKLTLNVLYPDGSSSMSFFSEIDIGTLISALERLDQ